MEHRKQNKASKLKHNKISGCQNLAIEDNLSIPHAHLYNTIGGYLQEDATW